MGNKTSFSDWMKAVDEALRKKCGMDHRDLGDCPYRDWYDDGVRATTAANRAFKENFDF